VQTQQASNDNNLRRQQQQATGKVYEDLTKNVTKRAPSMQSMKSNSNKKNNQKDKRT